MSLSSILLSSRNETTAAVAIWCKNSLMVHCLWIVLDNLSRSIILWRIPLLPILFLHNFVLLNSSVCNFHVPFAFTADKQPRTIKGRGPRKGGVPAWNNFHLNAEEIMTAMFPGYISNWRKLGLLRVIHLQFSEFLLGKAFVTRDWQGLLCPLILKSNYTYFMYGNKHFCLLLLNFCDFLFIFSPPISPISFNVYMVTLLNLWSFLAFLFFGH